MIGSDPNGYVLARLTRHSRNVWQAPHWLAVIVLTALSPNQDSEAFTEDTIASAAIVPPDGVYQVALISVPAGTAGSTTVNIQFWRKYLAAGVGDMRVCAVSVMAAA